MHVREFRSKSRKNEEGSGNYRSPAVVSQPGQKTGEGKKDLWSRARGWGLPYIMRQVTGIIVGPGLSLAKSGIGLRFWFLKICDD